MANPFLSFLTGGVGGYNQGRQQSIQNQQQQEQIDLARQAQMAADQARKAQLAEQIRAAMAGEDITRSGQGQQNSQFYAGLGMQGSQFDRRLAQDQSQFGQTLGLQRDQLTQQGNIAQGQLGLGRGQLDLQGYRTLMDSLPVLDKSGLNPQQRAMLLDSINQRMGLGANLPGSLPTSAGTQGDLMQQKAQIGNLTANTQATLAGIPLAQKRFGLDQQQLNQQMKIAQMQNETQRAVTGAQIGLRITELTADQMNRARDGVQARLDRLAMMGVKQREMSLKFLQEDIAAKRKTLDGFRDQASRLEATIGKNRSRFREGEVDPNAVPYQTLIRQIKDLETDILTSTATRDAATSDWGKANLK